jgi:nucleoside phosphorylase
VAIIRTLEQGHLEAQAAATDVIVDLDPRWLIVVGIAGAVPAFEFCLGDVIVATRVHDFSITAAIAGGRLERDVRGEPAHKAVQDVIARLPAIEGGLGPWNAEVQLGTKRPGVDVSEGAFRGNDAGKADLRKVIEHHFGTDGTTQRLPRCVAGAIASANMLMKDPAVLEEWLTQARSIRAIEMELPGVYAAARSRCGNRPVLAVRGVSDIVGLSRDHRWTAFACTTAAAFTRALLGSGEIRSETP